MKNIIFVAALLSLAVYAAVPPPKQYRVDLQVFEDGKLVSHPRVVLNAGKKGEVSDVNSSTGKGQFVEVTANPVPGEPDQALLQMVIGRIENGKKIVLGTPQLSALLKEEAAMEIEENGKQLFKVVATVSPEPAESPKAAPKKK